MENISTFITARLGSSRLPRKHLLQIKEKPVIEHFIERLKQAKLPENIILCTTTLSEDDMLEKIAQKNGILAFRGHPTDILIRWLKAAEYYKVDFIVSAEADDLFIDPEHIDQIVDYYLKSGADYITCKGLPFGATPTGIKVSAIRKVCELKVDDDTEGQYRYFTKTNLFNVKYIEVTDSELNHPEIRMTLDYKEDFEFFKAVYEHLYKPEKVFTLREVIRLLKEHPEIVKINQHVQQIYEERFKKLYSEVKLKPQRS